MHHRRRNVHLGTATGSRLEEEIAILERRLEQIGPDGDCGYEAAMIRFFEQQLGMRRAQLPVVDGLQPVCAPVVSEQGNPENNRGS